MPCLAPPWSSPFTRYAAAAGGGGSEAAAELEVGGEGGGSGGEGNGSDDGEERPNSMERASSGDGSNDGANQQVDEPGRKGKPASARDDPATSKPPPKDCLLYTSPSPRDA